MNRRAPHLHDTPPAPRLQPWTRRMLCGVVVWCVIALMVVGSAGDVRAQTPDPGAHLSSGQPTLPPPWTLMQVPEGMPSWVGLIRLREARDRYAESSAWADVYLQILAQQEAKYGRYRAAMQAEAQRPVKASADGTSGSLPGDARAVEAIEYVVRRADTSRVVMVNERHAHPVDRVTTLDLLQPLYDLGFRYLAAEDFNGPIDRLNDTPYPTAEDGTYLTEPTFGALFREARRIGFTLVAYEAQKAQYPESSTRTRQAQRDSIQADNLRRFLDARPEARVLVHAGEAHVYEAASKGFAPMARFFKQATGIDPFTVDQTELAAGASPSVEHPLYKEARAAGLLDGQPVVIVDPNEGQPVGLQPAFVDAYLFNRTLSFEDGHASWETLGGRRAATDVDVPECADRSCYVSARYAHEPADALAVEHAVVRDTSRVRLHLPTDHAVTIIVEDDQGQRVTTKTIPAR